MRLLLVDLQLPLPRSNYLGREPVGMMELGAYAKSKHAIKVDYLIMKEKDTDIEAMNSYRLLLLEDPESLEVPGGI